MQVEQAVEQIANAFRPGGWSIKDSYACLDLNSNGFSELFVASWIWLDPPGLPSPGASSGIAWSQVTSATEMLEWEAAWAGDSKNLSAVKDHRQFPESLLQDDRCAFIAGRSQDNDIVAGGILNASPGVVGLSNVFAEPGVTPEIWLGLVRSAAEAFPGAPLVGYERGADLAAAERAGFSTIGKLRVWRREGY